MDFDHGWICDAGAAGVRGNTTGEVPVESGLSRKGWSNRPEEFDNSSPQIVKIFQLALPDNERIPPVRPQQFQMIPISRFGFGELGLPVVSTSCWQSGPPTAVPVPKAAVYENDLTPGREHDVRTTREILTMQAEPIAHRVRDTSYNALRGRVLALDLPHDPTAHFRIKLVGH